MFVSVLFLLPMLSTCYEILMALNCGSYDRMMIKTKFFNFSSDSYYEGLASVSVAKNSLPDLITEPVDAEMLKTHRGTSKDHTTFTYRPIIPLQNSNFIVVFMLAETNFKNKGQRIFNIRMGDEIIFTVDMIAQIGYAKVMYKWIQFVIKDDVVYLNGTLPLANAYNYKTYQLKILFEGVVNTPKIEALMLLKGHDAYKYLNDFLEYEKEKHSSPKEYISDKYRRQPKLSYRPLNGGDIIKKPGTEFQKIFNKFYRIQTLLCILCGIFSIHHEKIVAKLLQMAKELREKQRQKKEKQKQKKEDKKKDKNV